MSRVYATQAEYRDWTGDQTVTASAGQLLRASLAVDGALVGAVYTTDSADMPTDAKIIEALRDATCAVLEYRDETGDTTGNGAASEYQSATLLGASYTRAQGAAGSSSTGGLPQSAIDVLAGAGLLSTVVATRG